MFEKLQLVNSLDTSKFYVIVAVSNPIRFYSRARLFHQFRKHIKDLGAHLVVVEAAYGARPHSFATQPMCNFGHVHVDRGRVEQGNTSNGVPVQRPWWPNRPDTNPQNLANGFEASQLHGMYYVPNEPAVITQTNQREFHIQLRTEHEIWHKENLINVGIQQLTQIDPEWQYVAWIDADVSFQRQDIVLETAQQLQHFDIVQMFSHATDLGPNMEPVNHVNGFVWSWFDNGNMPPQGAGYGGYYGYNIKGKFWHCGYAWAMRRRAAEKVALFDKAILGSADHHMAMALIGCYEKSLPKEITDPYKEAVKEWQEMVEDRLKRNVGYVPGLLVHYWHGKKAQRKYVERWKILIDNKYDPYKDISRDPQGLYRLNSHTPKYIKLRDDIRRYFRQRNEDSIDLE